MNANTANLTTPPFEPTKHFTPEEELATEHIGRQDEVDNEITDFVNRLIPPQYRTVQDGEQQFEYDGEWAGELRDEVQSIIFRLLELPESAREQFEMNFYPFLKNEEEEESAS